MKPEDQEKIYIDALLARLMELLNRDKAEVMQRLDQVKQRYPGEAATWYLVKTIWEVEQDALMAQGLTRVKRPATAKPVPKPIVVSPDTPNTPIDLARRASPKPSPQSPPPRRYLLQPTPQLIRLLNGDRAAAQRLLDSAQLQNPERTAQWVHDKVMWDLQRDRT